MIHKSMSILALVLKFKNKNYCFNPDLNVGLSEGNNFPF